MLLANRAWGKPDDPLALLVHGGGQGAATWERLGSWLAARGWRVVAVDQRGHGGSQIDPATADPSITAMADDLVETLAALGYGLPVELLLGHSRGALVSLTCAVRHPSVARRLVLLDPPGLPETFDPVRHASEVAPAFEDPEAFVRSFYAAGGVDPGDDVIARLADEMSASQLSWFQAVMGAYRDVDIVDLARRCTLPTLAVLGRDKPTPLGQDGPISQDLGRYSSILGAERARFASALQHGTVRSLETGHDIHNTAFDDLVGLLSDWLPEAVAKSN